MKRTAWYLYIIETQSNVFVTIFVRNTPYGMFRREFTILNALSVDIYVFFISVRCAIVTNFARRRLIFLFGTRRPRCNVIASIRIGIEIQEKSPTVSLHER